MRKIVLAVSISLLSALTVTAQVKTPAPSPAAELEQMVGLTEVKIEYSRPGVKGRTVFGDLVPFGKVWRTGANKAVQFTISTDMKVEGKELKKGKYALFTVPNKDNWDVIFYEQTEIWGTPDTWVDSLEAARVNVKTSSLNDMVESFTISVDNIVDGKSADLNISWEKTSVTVKLEAPTEETALKSIESTMAGPSAGDYYKAASYYLEVNKDLETALEWITKACEMRGEEAYWYFRKKSLIEAALGKYKEAIATAEVSLASAEKAGNADYVKMNKESIDEWKKK
jgi:hypothetical protein